MNIEKTLIEIKKIIKQPFSAEFSIDNKGIRIRQIDVFYNDEDKDNKNMDVEKDISEFKKLLG